MLLFLKYKIIHCLFTISNCIKNFYLCYLFVMSGTELYSTDLTKPLLELPFFYWFRNQNSSLMKKEQSKMLQCFICAL